MKTVCSVTPLYDSDIFVKPHFRMMTGLDKRIALIGSRPWPNYEDEHGVGGNIKTKEILEKDFPDVEIKYTDSVVGGGAWGMADFYNQSIKLATEYDYVTRFDVDMMFTKKDWKKMIDFVRNNDYDYYRMNFITSSINYYYDFDHGIRDGLEDDVMIIKTDNLFKPFLNPVAGDGYLMGWENWTCHHFRGWNKPKSLGNINKPNKYFKELDKRDEWVKCPKEIRDLWK